MSLAPCPARRRRSPSPISTRSTGRSPPSPARPSAQPAGRRCRSTGGCGCGPALAAGAGLARRRRMTRCVPMPRRRRLAAVRAGAAAAAGPLPAPPAVNRGDAVTIAVSGRRLSPCPSPARRSMPGGVGAWIRVRAGHGTADRGRADARAEWSGRAGRLAAGLHVKHLPGCGKIPPHSPLNPAQLPFCCSDRNQGAASCHRSNWDLRAQSARSMPQPCVPPAGGSARTEKTAARHGLRRCRHQRCPRSRRSRRSMPTGSP